jgi:hypothetical protein
MSAIHMNLITHLKQLVGWNKPDVCYVMATVRTPWSSDMEAKIAPFWCSNELSSMLNEPELKDQIVQDLHWSEETLHAAIALSGLQFFRYFPCFGCFIHRDKLPELSNLEFIEHIQEIPDELWLSYLSIIKGLHYVLERSKDENINGKVSIVNMSLQAPDSHLYHDKEPMNIATKVLTDNDITVVVAAGNFGPGTNTLNRWSVAPWVISVGAADKEGKALWDGSSRGIAGSALFQPTVVANGIDVISTRASSGVYEAIDSKGNYCIATGTSFATPQVSGIAALCHEFISDFSTSVKSAEWRALAESKHGETLMAIHASPLVTKRMIMDMAIKMPNYQPHEVGQGFVDKHIAETYLNNFNFYKFLRVFCHPTTKL